MKEHNPEYEKNTRGYKNRVATRCRICGGQLLLPEEIKLEMHERCAKKENKNVYLM
jgi:hypothetical protein|tara:strand:+ start:26 stop:193 length:168 start_codon:yes stop_codon:yes gene_type:complete